jgi:hypothetical protein
MNVARIVSSNSHIDYIARVIDSTDGSEELPAPADYCFGQFVSLEGDGEDVIGVIYDSRLVNPEYGSFGPRSGPRAELARHNADFVHEQGILIGVLLLGTVDASGKVFHGVPGKIVPVGQSVSKIDAEHVASFHTTADGGVHLRYYPQVVANARQFAIPLLSTIIDQLVAGCSDVEAQKLQVLKQSLTWQGTLGGLKL